MGNTILSVGAVLVGYSSNDNEDISDDDNDNNNNSDNIDDDFVSDNLIFVNYSFVTSFCGWIWYLDVNLPSADF